MKKKPAKEVYSLTDLKDWEKTAADVKPSIALGVIGDPVEHSLSPQIQNVALRECGIDVQYARFHIKPEELEEALQLARQNGFVGLNVTLPHKERTHGLVDQL